jgi:hypothetical protein
VTPTTSTYTAGSAAPGETPRTPRNIPHRGGAPNPSADALATQFPGVVQRVDVVWGETTVVIDAARALDVVRWLHDDPSQRYDYLSDVTAVEFRDAEQLRQALSANPEARYSMEELTIAEAFTDLPLEMRHRLDTGERTGE